MKSAGLGMLLSASPRYDPAVGVRSAGKANTRDESNKVLLTSPRTPDTLCELSQKHRRWTQPGEITVHWGAHGDRVPPRPEDGYGLPSYNKGESVDTTFRSGQKLGVAVFKDAVGEEVYQTTRREPLGRSYKRGHRLPEGTFEPQYRFGKASGVDRPAKESISPRNCEPESEEAAALYRKSHQSTRGGEMLVRNYDWPPIIGNAGDFRFGHVPAKDSNNQGVGVKSVLGGEGISAPATTILPEASVHHREVNEEKLGAPRNLNRTAHRNLSDGHVFGAACYRENFSTSELMHKAYSVEEQLPDRDLGRCIREGRRNLMTKQPLGVPSVRIDKIAPPRDRRSVASCVNFGDDASACSLLSPGRFNVLGVEDNDFRKLRTESELCAIFEGAGVGPVSPEAVRAAARACGSEGALAGSPVASVQAVMHACIDWSAARAAAPIVPLG